MNNVSIIDNEIGILSILPVAVLITDKDGSILYANEEMSRITGYSLEEMIGAKPSLWKSENHTLGFYKDLWNTICSGEKWEGVIQNKRKDGMPFWASVSISPIKKNDNVEGFVSIMRDVSYEYNQQQKLLDYYEQLYLNVLDSIKIGVGIINKDRSLVYINKQLKRWIGIDSTLELSMKQLTGLPFVSCCIDKSFATGSNQELTIEISDGVFKTNCIPIKQSEEVLGVIFVLIDITKEISIERELSLYKDYLEQEVENRTYALRQAKKDLEIQALELKEAHENLKLLYEEIKVKNKKLEELDRMKTEFVFTVSHELRTPLTTIREGVALIVDGVLGAVNEEQVDMLNTVLSDVDRLSRIVGDFLDLSKIESGKLKLQIQEVDICELVDNVLRLFSNLAKEKGLKIDKDFSTSKMIVPCDPDRISQVLVNLVGNAIKFTEEGYIKIICEMNDSEVLVVVEDTGNGVRDEEKEKVFDKFYQVGRKDGPGPKGTGLGLPISKGIIDLHGGKIWVEDNPIGGSRFCFVLYRNIRVKDGEVGDV